MKYLSNITLRFRADFAGLVLRLKSSIANIEVLALLLFIPDKEEFSFIRDSGLVYLSTSMNGQRPSMIVNHSVLEQSH